MTPFPLADATHSWPASWLHDFAHWCMGGTQLGVICMAQITTLLVIYGPHIEELMRKTLRKKPFLLRVSGFVLLHAFLFGILSMALAGILALGYQLIGYPWQPPVMLAVFLGIGLLAEEHKKI